MGKKMKELLTKLDIDCTKKELAQCIIESDFESFQKIFLSLVKNNQDKLNITDENIENVSFKTIFDILRKLS